MSVTSSTALSAAAQTALAATADKMLAEGQGILAADESSGTIEKRFKSIRVKSTEETRCAWRRLLFSSAEAMRPYIGGVILFEETLFQKDKDGTLLRDLIRKQDCVVGIKVDKGAKPLALCPDETITEGLDDLRTRLTTYYDAGARFAKWRAVLHMGARTPSPLCGQRQYGGARPLRRARPGGRSGADCGAGSPDGWRTRHCRA